VNTLDSDNSEIAYVFCKQYICLIQVQGFRYMEYPNGNR